MSGPAYTLNCSICGEPYASREPFPAHNVCPRCRGEGPAASTGGARVVDREKKKKDRKKAKLAKKARRKNRG